MNIPEDDLPKSLSEFLTAARMIPQPMVDEADAATERLTAELKKMQALKSGDNDPCYRHLWHGWEAL